MNSGHHVTLCTHSTMESRINGLLPNFKESSSFSFIGFQGDPEGFLKSEYAQKVALSGRLDQLLLGVQALWEQHCLDILRNIYDGVQGIHKPEFGHIVVVTNISSWCVSVPIAEALQAALIASPFMP